MFIAKNVSIDDRFQSLYLSVELCHESIIESRWFALADLALVSVCVVVWYSWPPAGRWLLLIALIPWFARVTVGFFPFKRTPLDLFLVIFIITAAVGVWAAYDRTSAWAKFCLIIWAILLFYAIAGQPHTDLWLVVGQSRAGRSIDIVCTYGGNS